MAHCRMLQEQKSRSNAASSHQESGSNNRQSSTRSPTATLASPSSPWHQDEHRRFLLALESQGRGGSGNEWERISAFVATRTPEEVQRHGRQYLQHLFNGHSQEPQQEASYNLARLGRRISIEPTHSVYSAGTAQGSGGHPKKTHTSRFASVQPEEAMDTRLAYASESDAGRYYYYHPPSFYVSHIPTTTGRRHGRKPKSWTFGEDKLLEDALANWMSARPYSWSKIATKIPGKSARDVKARYEKLVSDIHAIESHIVRWTPPPVLVPIRNESKGLRKRVHPPPPIQVPQQPLVPSIGTESGVETSARMTSSASLALSPSFLDFFGSEDKPVAPLESPDINAFESPLILPSPLATVSLAPASTTFSKRNTSTPTPNGAAQRVWEDFLSDSFSMDTPCISTRTSDLTLSGSESAETPEPEVLPSPSTTWAKTEDPASSPEIQSNQV